MVAVRGTPIILGASTDLDGGLNITEADQPIINGANSSVATTTSKIPASGGLISEDTYNKAFKIMQNIWMPVCGIGLVTNILNVIVFVDKGMRKSATSVYLIGISLLQITHFIITSTRCIPPLIYGEYEYSKTKFYFINIIYIVNYLGTTLIRTVYCLVMLVAFERMMAVLFPLKLVNTRLVTSPIICIVCLIFVSLSFHIYLALTFGLTETVGGNGTITYGMGRTQFDPIVLNSFSMAAKIIFVYIPLILLFIFNVVLCVALKRGIKTRKTLQESRSDANQEKRERQTTIAILVSTCIFFVLSLPVSIHSLVVNLVPEYNYFHENRYTFLFVQEVVGLLSIFSYCVDFVTYTVISSKYRLTLMRKCLPCRHRPNIKKRLSTQISLRTISTGPG